MTTANRVRLGDVLEVQSGFAFKKEFFTHQEGVPLIRIRDLDAEDTETKYNGPYREEFLVSRGDFLIGMDGEFRCHIWKGPKSLLNQRVCRLRNFASSIVPMYLYYGIQRYLSTIEAQTAFVTVKHISGRQIEEIEMPLPAVDDQQRIVDLLSRAENIVRMRREAEEKAKEIIPALFLDMFGDPATNPRGWDVKSLAALVTFVSGGTPSKSRNDYWQGRLPWVSPKDMKVPEIFDAEDHISDQVPVQTSIKLIPPGAVLIVVRGMILVHTVPVAITRAPVTVNQDMKALRANGFVNEEYLMWLLRISQGWLLTLVSTAAHGTRKIDTARLEALPIPIPPKALQESFVQRVRTLCDVTGSQSRAMERAEQSFQALLAGVFSEVRAT